MNGFFTNEQVEQLILSYMYSRKDAEEGVALEEVQAFLNACQEAYIEGTCVEMAANGDLMLSWSEPTGFIYSLSEVQREKVEKIMGKFIK